MAEASDNSAKTSSNTSLNSLADKAYGIEARAFHVIDASDIQLTPAEIARKIHYPRKPTRGQYTTVRVVCRKLLEKGLVMQPYPGAYCNKITYGMRFVPLMVHNIRLHSNVCEDVLHWECDEVVGGVKLHVCFGSERRKVSGFIACDVGGMSHDACLLAVNRWFDVVEGRLGWELRDLVVTSFELNKDYAGVRLDGATCYTKRDFFGLIERTYQKERDLVRREWKFSRAVSINKFEEAVNKGLVDIERSQTVFDLKEELRRNTEALKFANSRLLQLERLSEATSKAVCKLVDIIGKVKDEDADGGKGYVS